IGAQSGLVLEPTVCAKIHDGTFERPQRERLAPSCLYWDVTTVWIIWRVRRATTSRHGQSPLRQAGFRNHAPLQLMARLGPPATSAFAPLSGEKRTSCRLP